MLMEKGGDRKTKNYLRIKKNPFGSMERPKGVYYYRQRVYLLLLMLRALPPPLFGYPPLMATGRLC